MSEEGKKDTEVGGDRVDEPFFDVNLEEWWRMKKSEAWDLMDLRLVTDMTFDGQLKDSKTALSAFEETSSQNAQWGAEVTLLVGVE